MNEYEGITLRSPCSCGLCHFQWFRNGWICPGVSRSSNEVGHDVDPWALSWMDSDPGDSEISDSWSSTSNVGYRFGYHDYHGNGGTPQESWVTFILVWSRWWSRSMGCERSRSMECTNTWKVLRLGSMERSRSMDTPSRSMGKWWSEWSLAKRSGYMARCLEFLGCLAQEMVHQLGSWVIFLLREFLFHLLKNHKISCHAAPLGTGTSSLPGTNLAPWLKHRIHPQSLQNQDENQGIQQSPLLFCKSCKQFVTFRRLKSQIQMLTNSEVTEVLLKDPDPESNPCHCMLGRWFQSANSATNQTWS